MPFTFSHPALILPLTRLPKRWVSATGLVIGSIVPDFEKFLKMNDGNTYSHTLPVHQGTVSRFNSACSNA
jgi:hypothetical protein